MNLELFLYIHMKKTITTNWLILIIIYFIPLLNRIDVVRYDHTRLKCTNLPITDPIHAQLNILTI